jgi:hypothetical protein
MMREEHQIKRSNAIWISKNKKWFIQKLNRAAGWRADWVICEDDLCTYWPIKYSHTGEVAIDRYGVPKYVMNTFKRIS